MCYGQKDPGEETELPPITRSAHPTLSSLQTGQCITGGRHEHTLNTGQKPVNQVMKSMLINTLILKN